MKRGVTFPGLQRHYERQHLRVEWDQRERRTRSAPSPACGGGLERGWACAL